MLSLALIKAKIVQTKESFLKLQAKILPTIRKTSPVNFVERKVISRRSVDFLTFQGGV